MSNASILQETLGCRFQEMYTGLEYLCHEIRASDAFLKKGRPLLKKNIWRHFQLYKQDPAGLCLEKRSGMCSRSTFWLSFEAMFEMALLVMSPYFCVCVFVCVKQTDVYKKQ